MKTEGIVIDEIRHGETSKIITVFTKKYGVVRIMARGALLPGSSLLSVSHLFALSNLELSMGANLYYIKRCSIIDTHFELLDSYDKLIYGSFMLELINKSLPEGDINEKIFDLMVKSLFVLKTTKDPRRVVIAFSIKCITLLGYMPAFPKEMNENDYSFSVKTGIFSTGKSFLKGSYNLNAGEVIILRNILYSTFEEIREFNIDRETEIKIFKIIVVYIKFVLELDDFYSLKLLEGEDIQ